MIRVSVAAVVGQLAGQVDVLLRSVPGVLPRSTSWTVLAVERRLGSIGPLKVMLIVSGVVLAARLAADGVEGTVVVPWTSSCWSRSPSRR